MKKSTTHRLMVLAALLTAAVISGIFSVPKADAQCNTYYNSRSAFFFGYGWACAYTGTSCSECASGNTVCVESGGRQICWDYPAY